MAQACLMWRAGRRRGRRALFLGLLGGLTLLGGCGGSPLSPGLSNDGNAVPPSPCACNQLPLKRPDVNDWRDLLEGGGHAG